MMASYLVSKGRSKYAVKVLLVLRKEIAFQMRSQCPTIVDIVDTYYFDDKLWVGSPTFYHT